MKEKFIPTNNDLSYYPLLFKALEATRGDVVEMGTGHGSTPLLHDYMLLKDRFLHSYETNKEWFDKFKDLASDRHALSLLSDWDICSNENKKPSVVFIDHAPGERRKEDILRFEDTAGVLVIHDSEPTGAGNYKVRQHFRRFKYCVEVKTSGAWATALSNVIDVTGWIGEVFGDYEISGKDPR